MTTNNKPGRKPLADQELNNAPEAQTEDKTAILEAQNAALQNQIDEMKAMFMQFMQQQSQQMESVVKQQQEKEEVKRKLEFGSETMYTTKEQALDIKPHDIVHITSYTPGELVLKGKNGTIINIRAFGERAPVVYEDLQQIYINHRDLVRQGGILIHKKEVVSAFNLEKEYEKFISVEMVENIMELDHDEIRLVFKEAPKLVQQAILKKIVDKRIKGEYLDANKLETIAQVTGFNINEERKQEILSEFSKVKDQI